MALSTFVGSLAQPGATGNQAITGVGFQPKAVIFFGNTKTADGSAANANMHMGAFTSSTKKLAVSGESKDASAASVVGIDMDSGFCIRIIDNTAAVKASATPISLDADGFTINWGVVDATARIVNYIALGGSDITNATTGVASIPAATGNQAYTGVGFKPDCVLFFGSNDSTVDPTLTQDDWKPDFGFGVTTSSRGISDGQSRHGLNPTQAHLEQLSTKALSMLGGVGATTYAADLVSMDSDGFTLNYSTVDGGAADKFYYLALKGGQYKVGVFNQATSTGNQAVTGVGFVTKGIIVASANAVSSVSVGNNSEVSIGIGSSSSARGCCWIGDTHNVSPSVASQNLDRTKLIKMMTQAGASPTTQTAADLVSLDSDGFTINNSTTDATAREILYLAFGSNAVTSLPNKAFLYNLATSRAANF